ncbi:MAG: hypothetical protein HY094_03580 [Candidatus Melainabacteria bacterium]|nr:hypothetical protein [Candidatus Melainabacteria bacterium]
MELIKFFIRNGGGIPVMNYIKSGISSLPADMNLKKIDNVFKLIYQLFLYSIIGFFAKLVIKLFK